MNKQQILSLQKVGASSKSSLFADLKALVKAPVLLANVLPVFTGFWLALTFSGSSINEYWGMLLLTIFGSALVMAGALVLNNWYDVDIDSVMERTKNRPTVTGNIPLKLILMIGVLLTIIGFSMLIFTTIEAIVYAFIGWFTYGVLYTMWSKRKYTFNTVIGSVSGAVTPLIGWSVIAPSFQTVPLLLFLILFIWQMPHTFAIAMRKCEEYKKAGVAMLPVVRGFKTTKWQILVYVACLLPLPFFLTELGIPFVAIATVLNCIWLGISLSGLFTKDDQKYAYVSFLYSVNYVMILFLLMIVLTLPIF